MAVSYMPPLERAWERTRRMLFGPFAAEKWIVVGFAAFLAGLGGSSLGFGRSWRDRFPADFGDLPFDSFWFLFSLPFLVLALALGLALLWLSSRGKFIFLENMVSERAAIVVPWKKYGHLGDSLFFWRVGFYLATLLVGGMVLSPLFLLGGGALALFSATVLSLIVGLIVGCALLFLESFVVPLMYHRGLTTTDAWRVLIPLVRDNPVDFLLYALVILLAFALLGFCLVAATLLTCCIAGLVLSIPYVSTVLLLPLHALFRLYSLEFLAQYGPEYSVFPAETNEELS